MYVTLTSRAQAHATVAKYRPRFYRKDSQITDFRLNKEEMNKGGFCYLSLHIVLFDFVLRVLFYFGLHSCFFLYRHLRLFFFSFHDSVDWMMINLCI